MSHNTLVFLDWGFTIFHLLLSLFNITGWIFKKTRKINLITIFLTAFSWFILGTRFGYGYCPLTDWHWKILRQLNYNDLPNSYIKFIIDRFFGTDINSVLVDNMVVLLFFVAFSGTIILNIKDAGKKNEKQKTEEP
ncbi:MAG: DUF2784 domain-containing protein [Bacteroidales bacterium]|nr:DUF2784 domain-containing protein [Bacteroidales bacterium]